MALREVGFWDRHYEEELKNFDDAGDEGEVWFGRGLSRKIASYIVNLLKEKTAFHQSNPINILDIGCGNAFLLVTLAQKISSELPNEILTRCILSGLDYSANSIELSQKIVSAKELTDRIHLKQCDFLELQRLKEISIDEGYDIVIDVGTYDAICLLASGSDDKLQSTKITYMTSIYSIVKNNTIFVLASCNHTEEELMSLFELDCRNKRQISKIGQIDTPKLQFGGKEGSQVCCIILKTLG